jgi:hypothetical protein
VCGSIAAHRDKSPVPLPKRFPRKLRRVSRRRRSDHIDVQTAFAQPRQSRRRQFRGPSTTCRRIYDCEEAFHQSERFFKRSFLFSVFEGLGQDAVSAA